MTRKIHVLSVIDDLHFGGDECRLLAFARAVDRSRFAHTIVTILRPDEDSARRYGSMRDQFIAADVTLRSLDEIGSPDVTTHLRPDLIGKKGAALLRKVLKLKSLIRECAADVLDVHLPPTNPVGVAAALWSGIPAVITAYNLTRMQSARSWLTGQSVLAMADLLVTDSLAQAAKMRDWLLRRRPIEVIPNGTASPHTYRSRAEMRRVLGLPESEKVRVVGQIASLVPYKGQMALLDAARFILQQEPHCAFLFVGYMRQDREYQLRLQSRAVELGIADRVRILGYPGEIGDVWKAIDIHAHPSLLDSLPNAIMEGMSLSKPAVVTAVGGILEMVEHGVTGLVVPPGNAQALAQALLRVLRDPALATRLGREALKRHEQRYRPEIMAARLQDCFIGLAENRRSRAASFINSHGTAGVLSNRLKSDA